MAWILQDIHFHKRTPHRKHNGMSSQKMQVLQNKLPVHVLF